MVISLNCFITPLYTRYTCRATYPALYVNYISRRFCCYNIVHLFLVNGNGQKWPLQFTNLLFNYRSGILLYTKAVN